LLFLLFQIFRMLKMRSRHQDLDLILFPFLAITMAVSDNGIFPFFILYLSFIEENLLPDAGRPNVRELHEIEHPLHALSAPGRTHALIESADRSIRNGEKSALHQYGHRRLRQKQRHGSGRLHARVRPQKHGAMR
jgi:hypothetical protein